MAVGRNLSFGVDFKGITAKPIENINAKMDELKDKTQGASSKFEDMTKNLDKVGKGAQSVGKTLSTRVTAPLVGVGTAAVATVSSFDDAMANVQKISGATGEEFDDLRDKAKELGATTAFSAKENWSVTEKSVA